MPSPPMSRRRKMKASDKVHPVSNFKLGESLRGITVRDYIAIQAMKSLIIGAMESAKQGKTVTAKTTVKDAYLYADAMIEASND